MESVKKVCKHCGKAYKLVHFKINENLAKLYGSNVISKYCCDCDCIEKIEKENKKKCEAKEKQMALNKRFENSLISPYFKEKTFKKLIKTEEVIYCQNYVKTFNRDKTKGLQMIGNVGTGKTTLLAAISHELMNKGYTCLFITFSQLIEKFLGDSSTNSGNISKNLDYLKNFDFIVLDDIGRESYNTERKKEIAFRIIDTLLNYKIITCFSANPEMIEKLKGLPELKALLDRLKDLCPNKLKFQGESLRDTKIAE